MNIAYQEYLKTDHWRELRKRAIDRWGDRCSNCSVPGVDVHHLRYGNLFDVTEDDLMPLCRRCHDAVHASRVLSTLWGSDATSECKRQTTKAFLAGRDDAMRERAAGPDTKITTNPPVDDGNFVILSKDEARRVVAGGYAYRWMINNGIDPRVRKWKRRIVGIKLPSVIFGKWKS